ncbi:NADP-dependent oxidoreductase [Yinghuangia seranimata]|uniref:NADP-dependent oxidoreductase n=1 Tax=Yinghuangia seranimata TaxID=408067 RepID=UPI00248ACE48|nr:NADP-dependent oxidoreductase [Yinghuangia seranimata]MDI2124520.1 NADP-dependent oxidoreductase [Yinghuangia seranimata]
MRAVAVAKPTGSPELMRLPVPEPGPGEVLVKVVAAGLNPVDWKLADRARDGVAEAVYPLIYGVDFAGKVAALGPGVSKFNVGDAVFGQPAPAAVGAYGTYAEYVVAAEDGVLALAPDALPLPLAAALPTAGMAALSILDVGGVEAAQTLLLVGAAGGVGSFVTQLAASRDVRVVAVTRGVGELLMGELGAADTVDAKAGPPVDALREAYPDGVDALVDLVSPPEAFAEYATLVSDGGVAISAIRSADVESLARRGVEGVNFVVEPNGHLLARLAAEVSAGRVTVQLGAQVPLADAPDAVARGRAGKAARGKTVILV